MPIAAIAMGSNLHSRFGTPAANLKEAVKRLRGLGEVLAISSFFETEPVGYVEQPQFTNAVVTLQTRIEPVVLLGELLRIEREMGRDRSQTAIPKGPRMIDLDLLLFDGLVIKTASLTLPHPEMKRRRFVLEPLAEIAPGWVDPMEGITVAEMLANLSANG